MEPKYPSVPPQPSLSPDGRSYSPSKSSETPADWSAGMSTAHREDESFHHFSVDTANQTTRRKFLPLAAEHRSSQRGRCLRSHTRTAPSFHRSYWPPDGERSYLEPERSVSQKHTVDFKVAHLDQGSLYLIPHFDTVLFAT